MAQRYETYKDSGVQWLGEIPSHWKTLLNGILFVEDVRKPEADDIPLSLSQVDGVIPTDEMKESSLKTSSYDNWKRVIVDDLVLNRFKAHLGVMFASNYVGMVSFHYGVFKAKMELVPKYYEYLYHTNVYRFIYADASKGMTVGLQNLSNTSFYNVRAIYPPKEEQQSIVAYLDDKCGKIDEWANQKRKEVEHLQELKQRVIADAVTRGLNPNVTMKQTGVFWWKETPEHWQKIRLGYILQKMNRMREPNSELLVCTNKGKVIKRGETKIGLIADSEEIYQGVAEGDLLIHGMDTWHGAIAVSNFNGMCTPVVHVCTSNENLYFVAYYMQVMAYSKIFKLISNGVRQNTSDFRSWSKVDKIPIMLPPKQEQDSIVSYISDKTAKIEKLIANINKEIEAIKEYKQRLISDVVTGQIKVF